MPSFLWLKEKNLNFGNRKLYCKDNHAFTYLLMCRKANSNNAKKNSIKIPFHREKHAYHVYCFFDSFKHFSVL